MTELLAPNGKPSNLSPEQYKLVRTTEFKKWFGDWEKLALTKINDSGIDEISLKRLSDGVSKVVDENGEPLVMYHGSPYDFSVFETNEIESDRNDRDFKSRFWFIVDKNWADNYSKSRSTPTQKIYKVFLNIRNPKYDFNLYADDDNDGSIEFRDKKVWVAIATLSNQIKLADGMNTKFDGNNPDIRFEEGGTIDLKQKQLEIIHRTNPAPNEYNLWIRKVEDIKTAEQVFSEVYEGESMSPDFTTEDMTEALNSGYVTVFSSYPIKEGVFVTPSKMNALIYAGGKNGKIFSKRVKLTDIAWIDESEGQYAPTDFFEKGGLLAPNGNPSNLTPEQYRLVRTPAFKKWFGDWENSPETASKVVDENGEPLVCYHGTDAKFNVFNKDFIGSNFKLDKIGFFFTSSYHSANMSRPSYPQKSKYRWTDEDKNNSKNGFVISSFLNIRIPLRIKEIDNLIYDSGVSAINTFDHNRDLITESILRLNKDGFILHKEGEYLVVALNPNQIKLADGTNTTFDGNNPDIRFEEGGFLSNELLEKAREIANKNEYLNCDAFCHRMIDNKLFKEEFEIIPFNLDFEENFESQYNSLIKVLNTGDIIAFGEKNNVRHYAIYLADDDVLEVEMWGGKPRVFSLKNNLYNYENVAFIYRENKFKKGGRTIAQTPAPKKDQIKGSEKNKQGSSKDLKSAKKIELSDKTIEAIKNKVDKHNQKHPNKKITIDSAKAVVRRGMGAYSSSHRPTITGGNPNSRVAWGLARLNAFLYKIVNGKSKSGKYSQDNDLIEELGYKVEKYEIGGIFHGSRYHFDKFDTNKIGSGIGEQDSGWGIYLTDDKESAKYYGNYIYETTLFEGKKISEYNFLNENKPVKKELVRKIVEALYKYYNKEFDINKFNLYYEYIKDKSLPKVDFNDYELIEFSYSGYLFYKTLSRTLGGDKKASLFLLNNGIDGSIKQLENHKGEIFRTDYVIYDENAITINNTEYSKHLWSDGGDIQAYEDAMDISQFEDGGETKPKKVYVSIELKTEIEGEYPNYFFRFNEKPFEELKNGVLEGITGVSSSTSNVAEWFSTKDCLIVMDYEKFMASNQTETINYYDPYQLMANKLFLFKRLYGNITRYGEQENVYQQTLTSICPKIRKEIMLEMEISEGQKYRELYRIDRFLDPNNTSAFYRWANVKQDIESPIDLTNAILEFNKIDDSYLGDGFENPVLTFDELLPLVELGIVNAGTIWESEQEIILKNRTLVLPKQSQLFFIKKDEIGRVRASNQLELVDKYKLKDLYKVYFVDRQDVEKYRTIWKNKYYQEKELQYEKSKYNLELKKDQVVNELFGIFINNSLKSFKEQYEKDYISDLSESRMFYDTESDDYQETYWQGIVLVQFILNEYIEIFQRNWKKFIESKSVENLNLYSFSNLFGEVKYELQEFFDKNKYELEKINNWSEIRGNGYLNLWGIEYLLKKSVDDYENLPEWIDYKELSKMYLDKMGRELYRYYDKKDLPLISKYKYGGEADEPNEFWGTEAGGVLVYCSTTDRYLILLRSDWVLEPNTWGIISGKLDDDETNIEDAVLRESEEETGHKLGDLIPSFIFEKPNFKFHNFVSIVEEEFIPKLNWENDDYRWVKINEMPENLHFGLKLLLEKEDVPKLVEKNKNDAMIENNPKDTITMDIPLLIRFAELMREDIKTDVALHEVVENLLEIKDKGVLTMEDYESIVGNVTGLEEDKVEEPKMEEGGKVPSIHSQKGDIKISLDDNWYSDDSSVELVPVSELIKFREFDRKVNPKYNQDNSRDNINHLKFMFQKEGVKSPIIIEYSPEDNVVLIIEGNHRLNSAIDLGMEYLPARVVVRKYGKYSPAKIKNAMQVNGIKANQDNYIPSDLKPSQVGIMGAKPIIYGDGGIIEGRLHSECGDDGCGRKFQVGENGHTIEAERDEAVIVADAFSDNKEMTIEGTPSEIASALNVIGGGKNFDKGAKIIENGQEKELPEMKEEATDTDVDDVIDSGSIIINRRSMADEKTYEVTGSAKQIASAINSINGNGVVIEKGAEIKES